MIIHNMNDIIPSYNTSSIIFSELAPRVFFKLTELKLLDLSNNPIQFIDGATFVDIPDLEIFKCNHCELFQVNNFTKILNFHTFY